MEYVQYGLGYDSLGHGDDLSFGSLDHSDNLGYGNLVHGENLRYKSLGYATVLALIVEVSGKGDMLTC